MQWASLSEFWAMGGYGLYVWGSYFVALIAILLEIIFLRQGRKNTLRRLRRMRSLEAQ